MCVFPDVLIEATSPDVPVTLNIPQRPADILDARFP